MSVSLYGDWLTTLALVVVLFRLTGSISATAGYFLFRTAPRVVGPTIGGQFADRLSPTLVIAWASVAQAAFTVLLAAAARSGSIVGIYFAVAASQFAGSVARPCVSAAIPRLASEGRWNRLNSLYSSQLSMSMLLAPAIGALLLQMWGYLLLLIVDAATFCFVSVVMLSLPLPRNPRRPDGIRRRILAIAKRGLGDPIVRSLAAAQFGSAAVVTVLQAVLVVAAARQFGGDTNVGLLYAGVGAGGLVGAAMTVRLKSSLPSLRLMMTSAFLELISIALLSIATSLVTAFGLLMISAIGAVLYQVRGTSALQRVVPAEELATANGFLWALSYSGMVIGALIALALSSFQWQIPLVGTALCATALVAIAGFPAVRPATGLIAEVHAGIEDPYTQI